jgi:hypothetical protein
MIRAARASRVARIVATIDGCPLADIDSDARWFVIWSAALGVGAKCPSDKTRHAVREAVRQRLPPLAEVFRDELEQLERAREAGMEVWKP